MKKFYLMLVMLCSVFAFAACSDDDDAPSGGSCPVTDYSVKTPTLELGAELTIAGKGFTQDSKIFLKDATGKATEVPVKTVSASDIVCTLPASGLALGQYTVILRQEGADWEMGKLTLLVLQPIKDYTYASEAVAGRNLAIKGTGFGDCKISLRPDEGDDVVLTNITKTEEGVTATIPAACALGEYTLIVEQDGATQELGILKIVPPAKRLVKIEYYAPKGGGGEHPVYNYEVISTTTFTYDDEGRVTTWNEDEVDYSQAGKIIVKAHEEGYEDMTFELDEQGRAKKAPDENQFVLIWNYAENGFIDNGVWEDDETMGLTYHYNGDDLDYIEDNYLFGENIQFSYGTTPIENGVDGVDLFAVLMKEVGFSDWMLRMFRIGGKIPAHLPVSAVDPDDDTMFNMEFSYGDYVGKYITKITVKDRTITSLIEDMPPYYKLTWE